MWKTDVKHGLIYHDDKDISKYLSREVTEYQHTSNQFSMEQDTKLKVLLLHTVGNFCHADCDFCCSVKDRPDTRIDIDKVLEMVKNDRDMFDDNITLGLTGGEPLNYYKEVIEAILPLFNSINITFFTSLFVPQKTYQTFIKDLSTFLNKKEKIDNIRLCVSLDYGSKNRHSSSLEMDTEDVFIRVKELCDIFEYNQNFHMQIYNVYTSTFDKNKIVELYNWFNENKNKVSSITYNMVRDFEEGTPSFEDIQYLQNTTRDLIDIENLMFTRFSYICVVGSKYKNGNFLYLHSQQLKLIELEDGIYKSFAGNFCPMYAKIQLSIDPNLKPGLCFHLFDVYKEYDGSVYEKCKECPSEGSCGYCSYFRHYCVDNGFLYKDYLKAFMEEVTYIFNNKLAHPENYIIR